MSKDKKYRRMVNYTSRDFDSIKRDLLEMARRYYPESYKDFSEASFGSLMVDSVAYIGDMLSFYMDYSVNESFMDTANEFNNIIRHAKQFGYKYHGRNSATGFIAIYVLVPASSSGLGPSTAYIPILKKGAQFTSGEGGSYVLVENVDFSDSRNRTVVARTNSTTGLPTYYAIKAYGRVISGTLTSETIEIGPYEPYISVTLSKRDVAEVLSVLDTQGNEYYEVDYLSQDVIYSEIVNNNAQSDNVPSLLKPISAPRRFVVERGRNSTSLQFGYGSDSEISNPSVVEPSNVVLNMYGKDYTTDTAFDPSNLVKTDKFGISPANTTLTISYRVVSPSDTNSSVATVNNVVRANFEFPSTSATNKDSRNEVITSIECSNEEPIVGSVSLPSREELKRRSHDFFATQNRAVTKQDYEALVYNMDKKFGTVKRCNVFRDDDSLKRNLNMYVMSENSRGKLVLANNTVKRNLKVWLNKYRMLNDTIDILDAYIVNIGIDFVIIANESKNKFDVIESCLRKLREKSSTHNYIGEPFYISDIYSMLNRVDGVVDVVSVNINRKTGSAYSSTKFNIRENSSADGRYVKVPQNVILEIKYPMNDIKGSVK
jgi:hypothetical protein